MSRDQARAAEAWVDDLPDDRKAQVHRWLTERDPTPEQVPGQTAIPLRGHGKRDRRRGHGHHGGR